MRGAAGVRGGHLTRRRVRGQEGGGRGLAGTTPCARHEVASGATFDGRRRPETAVANAVSKLRFPYRRG